MAQNDFTFGKAYKGNKDVAYTDAILKKNEIKRKAVSDARNMHELAAMSLPRKERRRLAKINGISKIVGSTKPFVK